MRYNIIMVKDGPKGFAVTDGFGNIIEPCMTEARATEYVSIHNELDQKRNNDVRQRREAAERERINKQKRDEEAELERIYKQKQAELERLKKYQYRIQEIIARRGIKCVVHFTREDNILSIMEHGLCPRSVLDENKIPFIPNDEKRIDGTREASCLSISFPNYKLFYSFRKNNSCANWVVLVYDTSILWNQPCVFCRENAASNTMTSIPLESRKTPEAFEAMFDEYQGYPPRAHIGLENALTTNPQAEILVFSIIPSTVLKGIVTPDQAGVTRITSQYPAVKCKFFPAFFGPRPDYGLWTHTDTTNPSTPVDLPS